MGGWKHEDGEKVDVGEGRWRGWKHEDGDKSIFFFSDGSSSKHVKLSSHGTGGLEDEHRGNRTTIWVEQQCSWLDPVWCAWSDLGPLLCLHFCSRRG